MGVDELERMVGEALVRAQVHPHDQERVTALLDLVQHRDGGTYTHSLRIGLHSYHVAQYLGEDERSLLLAGLLHDIGKSLVPTDVLQNTGVFTQRHRDAIRLHPDDGYRMLQDILDFTANVVVRHHRHQSSPYPTTLPTSRIPFSTATQDRIAWYAELVSIADFYDARTTRANSAGTPVLDGEELKREYRIHRPQQAELAAELLDAQALRPLV